MRILIIDGQGGGIGARLVSLLRPRLPAGCELLCTCLLYTSDAADEL